MDQPKFNFYKLVTLNYNQGHKLYNHWFYALRNSDDRLFIYDSFEKIWKKAGLTFSDISDDLELYDSKIRPKGTKSNLTKVDFERIPENIRDKWNEKELDETDR